MMSQRGDSGVRPVSGRLPTGQRPMTAVSGAGYTSSQRRGTPGYVGSVSAVINKPALQNERWTSGLPNSNNDDAFN